ncbi:MAG: ornithine cyclodeaminase family protein [Stellaceae bacterium]
MQQIEPLLLSRADIEAAAMPPREVIAIIEDTYRAAGNGGAEVPTKIGVHPGFQNSFLHAMPAWVPSRRALGMKWISYYPGNAARGFPDAAGVVVLNDPEHGLPVAILEAMWITYARTAACAAVMAKHFARPDPRRLGLVGCGGLARWTLPMLTEVFPTIRDVSVVSRTPASRESFVREMGERGPWRIKPESDLRRAVDGMDIIVSSIPRPPKPVLSGAWWSEGALAVALDVVGAWDQAALSSADRLVTDDYDGLRSRAAALNVALTLPERHSDIGRVVAGKEGGRASISERVMAAPTGVASMDVALGRMLFERARDLGLGRRFTFA